jgi:hypothetical protein
MLFVDLESAKLFTQPRGLNKEMSLGTTKEINLSSGHEGLVELTNRYAKLVGAGIPTRMDTSTREVGILKSKYIMNGSDKSMKKINLMEASES